MPKKKAETIEKANVSTEGSADEAKYEDVVNQMQQDVQNPAEETPEAVETIEKIEKEEVQPEEVEAEPEEAEKGALEAQESESEPSDTEVETQARELGWKPKDDYAGNPDDWNDARSFLKFRDLFDTIKKLHKVVNTNDKAMKRMASINEKLYTDRMQEKTDVLTQQKREAIENGNVEAVENYEKALNNLKQEAITESTDNPEYVKGKAEDFKNRNNSWFNQNSEENKDMMAFAITRENMLLQQYPDVEERFEEVEKAVRRTFPHKFENPARKKAPVVNITASENASYKTTKPKKFTFNQLSSEDKRIAMTMAKRSGLSLDDYAQQMHDYESERQQRIGR